MLEKPNFVEWLIAELNRRGYECAQGNNEIKVSRNGFPVTDILGGGDYRIYKNAPNDDERHNVRAVYESFSEAYKLYENGIPLNSNPEYHIMCEYGNCLMAAKPMGCGYMEFVTWQRDDDKTWVELGHYFAGYEAAKEDFAVRCGLVNRYKMFNETELKLIHQGLVHLGADYPHLTAEQMANVGKLIDKVEIIVPAIQERSVYESHEFLPEDGLEI